MQMAIDRLEPAPGFALIDGNRDHGKTAAILLEHQTVVKGDSLSASIAAASILAKVSRDRYMEQMAERYPEYEFERHKATAPSGTMSCCAGTAPVPSTGGPF